VDIDAINSVQFSNHTGYKSVKGQILSEKDLNDLFQGLLENNLHLTYSHLLSGYIGNLSFLHEVKNVIQKLKETNSSLTYGKLTNKEHKIII
jgi:pyridoxine kinase